MAYDEILAQSVRDVLKDYPRVVEKKMFGGLAFMVSGNMCCGIVNDTLMARVGPGMYASCLQMAHVHEMDFTGKPMKGMVYVKPEGIAAPADLGYWVGLCVDFAKSLPPK